ncbi:Peptidoglycan-binding domain 1 protein [Streptomyces venezuelae]|nr:Peptidoglycan-binding domain 1 protein [Streptomyces venezuelae]
MTGHVCPECGVHRPGCACAQAEIAAAEDFDPLRIRPYVTLDAAEPERTAGAGGPAGLSGSGGPAGSAGLSGPAGLSGSAGPASVSGNYAAEDPPTTQLAAIRPDGPTTPYPAAVPYPAASTHPTEALPGPHSGTYTDPHSDPYADTHADPHSGTYADPYAADAHADRAGDPSETMPLLLHGIGRVADPADDRTSARGRRRGMVVAAVAAVAVVGTAALAAAVLGGGDEGDDRATGLEITTSASLNVAVSEAPSPSASSETPEPSSSSPSVRATTTSASPSATSTPSDSPDRSVPQRHDRRGGPAGRHHRHPDDRGADDERPDDDPTHLTAAGGADAAGGAGRDRGVRDDAELRLQRPRRGGAPAAPDAGGGVSRPHRRGVRTGGLARGEELPVLDVHRGRPEGRLRPFHA